MATRKTTSMELKVGITAAVALALLTLMIFTVKKIHFGKGGYPIDVSFQFVDAINPQADVVIGGGVKIGYVSDISVVDDRVHLKVFLNNNVKVPNTAKFQILSKGLMGDKYLNVVAQEDTGEYLRENEHVEGIEPTNIDKAFQRFGQVADSIKMLLGDPEIQVSLGTMMKNFGSLSQRLDRLVKTNEVHITRSFSNLSTSTEAIKRFSKDIAVVTAELEKMLSPVNQANIAQTLENLKSMSSRLDMQIAKIEQQEGPLGVLINDEQLAKDLKALIKELKENPWKLLWKK
ncbi:MCE family protein [candidate division FCPU426 bacterium]|nr:MCE family protein [candidate division FCPU426 bacterium]